MESPFRIFFPHKPLEVGLRGEHFNPIQRDTKSTKVQALEAHESYKDDRRRFWSPWAGADISRPFTIWEPGLASGLCWGKKRGGADKKTFLKASVASLSAFQKKLHF